MSVGAALQRARNARGLTCEQLTSRTRIPLRIIVAMERDDWTKVPGGIFARGYVRAYAKEVGLDANELAARFEAEQAPPPVESVAPPPGLARPRLRVRWPVLSEDARRWLAGPVFVVLLVLVYLAGRASGPDPGEPSQTPEAAKPPAVAAAGEGAEEPGRALTSAPTSPVGTSSHVSRASVSGRPPTAAVPDESSRDGAPLVLDVEVTRECWVTASADATRVVYRLLQPGERVQARGHVLMLHVGDAGALRLSLDGEPAKPLGESGQVVSLRITRQNYRSLLPS